MSYGEPYNMPRMVLHRSYGKLVLLYDDGYEATYYDKERIRWLLSEADSLVSHDFSLSELMFLPQKN